MACLFINLSPRPTVLRKCRNFTEKVYSMTSTLNQLNRCFLLLTAALFCLLVFGPSAKAEGPADEKNPFAGDAAAIAFGKTIYEATCTGYCHTTAAANRV